MIFSFFLICCGLKQGIIIQKDEKEILRNRINEYWQYQIEGKIDKAYLFEVPEYREKVTLLGYLNRFKLVQYLEATLIELDIKGDEGNALMSIKYRVMLRHFSKIDTIKAINEKWMKMGNEWYHVPEGMEKIINLKGGEKAN